MTPEAESKRKQKLQIVLDFRIISLLLVLAIAGMLLAWKPWAGSPASDRTVEVTGETTVRATPDEFVFYPMYQVRHSDKQAALAELAKKSDEIVAKLKELGIADRSIQTNASGYDYPVLRESENDEATYTLQLTVTLAEQTLAQKVQDYLLTTSPTGTVSPQYSLSDKKQKQLEAQARDTAAKEARSKAVQMGKNLGFTVGKVKSVSDGSGFGIGPMPFDARVSAGVELKADAASLALQPGENELPYSVTVVYYIR